ncbi:MAG: hypothetical protein D8M58_11660 [Calditrichaeota bacterium]|nr:MAG: hypothetical protein DWQ03_12445 [Calditrichota bacterium]MBL1206051.1 hypothetical protein [Calditrichota bacterium]NOG45878.1 hypothetical protein [Calditrichota bacterium]
MKYIIQATCLLFISFSFAFSQEEGSLEETLQNLSADAAGSYLNPIGSGFGADLNAGWFHKAPQDEKFGFDLEVGFVFMGSQFPSDATHFSTQGNFKFSSAEAEQILSSDPNWASLPGSLQDEFKQILASQAFEVRMEGATIIGPEEDKITITFPGQTITEPNSQQQIIVEDQVVELPGGGFKDLANLELLPMATPQLSIGTIYGTQATFRYLPDVPLNDDLGNFKYFGFGLQHNPAAWLPVPLPLDVSAGFFTQQLKIGKLFKTNTTAFGLNASKQFGFEALNVTPYAGFMLESSTMEVTYDFIVNSPSGPLTQEVNFEIEGKNTSRLTLGLSIRFLIINLNADYNIGKYNNVSVGINFAI